jgi:molecular chaperone DnaK
MVADNKSLGRFVLDGIAPAPRGLPQIEVTFNIDANGILNVTAKDKGTGKEQSITIQNSGNLDKAEVEKMAKDAEAHAEEDKKKRESIEARNGLENGIYQLEKFVTDNKEKVSEEDKQTLDDASKEAKKVLDDEEAGKDALEAAAKELSDKMMPIGAKIYEEAAKEEEAKNAESKDGEENKGKKDEPVEGEVVDDEEVEEKAKKEDK